ncbi:hypothetical protein Tco_0135167, partial [Tanacetum coccineum]
MLQLAMTRLGSEPMIGNDQLSNLLEG